MADIIRVGMIGCDTSHCGGFVNRFHNPEAPSDMQGLRVVAAYPSFSEDLKASFSRVEGYKKELAEKYGVKMVDSVEELIDQVDAFLLESVDGRRHLKEFIPLVASGKPVYIDKPFAASLADAKQIVKLVKQHNTPCFSSSSLRFDSAFVEFLANLKKGDEKDNSKDKAESRDKHQDKKTANGVLGCDAYSPAHLQPTNPGFFWYGIHGVEILYTLMGTGCERVQCSSTPDGDLAVGVWKDGRLGSMRGIRKGAKGYGAVVLHEKGYECLPARHDFYDGLCRAIVKFFKTKQPPVPIDETLELCAFIDAAWRSSQAGGDDVALDL